MREKILEDLRSFSEAKFAQWLKPFLRITEESEEVVLGVRVPTLRKLAKKYKDIDLKILKGLLHSNIHESRALAVFIMILKSKKEPKAMCDLYLNNLNYINNWDLIDYSAPYIVAPNVEKEILRRLAESDYLWANRVAMVSTIYYIKQGNFAEKSLKITILCTFIAARPSRVGGFFGFAEIIYGLFCGPRASSFVI